MFSHLATVYKLNKLLAHLATGYKLNKLLAHLATGYKLNTFFPEINANLTLLFNQFLE